MATKRPRMPAEPPLGTVFYEIGWKRESPCGPIVITRVYCGRANDPATNGAECYLAVEFSKWWFLTNVSRTAIGPQHALKFRSLKEMLRSMKCWEDVCAWVWKDGRNWEKAMTR